MSERAFLIVRGVVVFFLAMLVTLIALPSPIRSQSWTPPRAPNLEGPFSPNEKLRAAERLAPGQVEGPEDIAIDDIGRIYAGTSDGKIVRMFPGFPVEVFSETGGRPLGLRFAPDGHLVVADALKGVLLIDPAGHVETLATEVEGHPLRFPNDVEVGRDGTIYVTDSSSSFGYPDWLHDILEAAPTGRLIRFDRATRKADVIARGLAFPNGIVLAEDQSYALVNETARYRVTRIWLVGDKRNVAETVVDNLPGFPGNISRTPRGTYWVAMFNLRKPALDFAHPLPFFKDCYAGLPEHLRPHSDGYGLIFELDANGRALRSLHDPDGLRFRDVSSAEEFRGALYIGSLTGSSVGRLEL